MGGSGGRRRRVEGHDCRARLPPQRGRARSRESSQFWSATWVLGSSVESIPAGNFRRRRGERAIWRKDGAWALTWQLVAWVGSELRYGGGERGILDNWNWNRDWELLEWLRRWAIARWSLEVREECEGGGRRCEIQ